MSHIYKRVFNIRQNLKLEIQISLGGSSVNNGSGISVQKFYPTGKSESFEYSASELVYTPLSNNDDTMLYFDPTQPPEFVNSLLSTHITRSNILPKIGYVRYGIVPTILAAQQKISQEKYFQDAFGLLVETPEYTNTLATCTYEVGRSRIHSINRNKQYVKYKYYMTGKIFKSLGTISHKLTAGNSSVTVGGISYDSDENDIDYLNSDVCVTDTTIVNLESSNFISNHIEIDNTLEPELIKGSLSTDSVINEYNYYIHYGSSPLLQSNHRYTDITGEALIDSSVQIIGISTSGGNDIGKIAIVGNGYGSSTIVDCTEYTYSVEYVGNIPFYTPLFVHKTRTETVITATVPCSGGGTYQTFCPVTKGLGFWQDLLFLVSNLTQLNKEQLMQDTIIDDNNIPKGYVKENGIIIPFTDYVIKEGAGSVALYNLTHKLNVGFATYMTQQSSTTMVPVGRNSSMRHIHSTRVSPLSTDQDSQSFQGGALPPQTYVQPTTVTRATYGDGNVPKNISLDHVVIGSYNDLINVAENFRYLAENIASVNVNFQGFASNGDLQDVIGSQYLIDSITVDYANNTTTFECRAAIY